MRFAELELLPMQPIWHMVALLKLIFLLHRIAPQKAHAMANTNCALPALVGSVLHSLGLQPNKTIKVRHLKGPWFSLKPGYVKEV